MHHLGFHILADTDDAIKLVFGVIVAIIWGISALASFFKKQQKDGEEQRRHRENWERINQEMRARATTAERTLSQPQGWTPPHMPPGMPPLPQVPPARPASRPPPPPVFAPTRSIDARPVPVRQPVPRRVIPVAQPAHRQPPARPKQKPKKQKSRDLPPAPPLPSAIPAAVPVAARAVSEARPAARPAAPAPADAAALSRWLNPGTLRSQFILTEILQPPLALRDPGDAQPRGL